MGDLERHQNLQSHGGGNCPYQDHKQQSRGHDCSQKSHIPCHWMPLVCAQALTTNGLVHQTLRGCLHTVGAQARCALVQAAVWELHNIRPRSCTLHWTPGNACAHCRPKQSNGKTGGARVCRVLRCHQKHVATLNALVSGTPCW